MGFLDNSGAIYIDAVLTDAGREKLARNDGSFSVVRWRPGDDEINYKNWNELTGSDSKDRKILDTPVFEAFTNENYALKYPLITIRNARLQYLPYMVASPSSADLTEQEDSTAGGKSITVSQVSAQGAIPAELLDVNYSVEVDNDLIYVFNEIPVAITPYGTAKYIISADSNVSTSTNGTQCTFKLRVQSLSKEIFDVMVGGNTSDNRKILSTCTVVGQQSGLNVRIPISILEYV